MCATAVAYVLISWIAHRQWVEHQRHIVDTEPGLGFAERTTYTAGRRAMLFALFELLALIFRPECAT